MRLKLLATIAACLLGCGAAAGETLCGVCIDTLWEGTPAIRQADFKALRNAKFDLFGSQISALALTDPNSADAQFLDACKASGAKAIVFPNALPPEQWKALVAKWPEVIIGIMTQDDANGLKPADVAAKQATFAPFLSVPGMISVGKNAKHSDYGDKAQLYHVQTYLGRLATKGEGLKQYGFDAMLQARAACPGKLLGAMYVARVPTPYPFRADPVFRSQEFSDPSQQEGIAWLQLIAGADHLLSYTAYFVDRNNPLWESRLGERWDLLAGYERINAKIKEHDAFLSGAGVVKTRSVDGNAVIGTWTKPGTGEALTARVDLASELYPRVTWDVKTPQQPVVVNVKLTSDGRDIRIDRQP